MTTIEVLLTAWAAGLVLERRGDQVIVRGLKPGAPPELLDLLREHKPQLLALMTDREASEPHSPHINEVEK
jgi:hypothetical protein